MSVGMNELTRCAGEEVKGETAKELLESMSVILENLYNEVRMISDAVYRGGNCNRAEEIPKGLKEMPPMIAIMRGQRDSAGEILTEVTKIREALW